MNLLSLRPNLQVGVEQGESMYKKWYFEVEIDFIESLKGSQPHCRIGWASTDFHPTPDGADGFSSIGVGDDVYSFGFDGANLWFGKFQTNKKSKNRISNNR
jgi:ryanodine receptor 2